MIPHTKKLTASLLAIVLLAASPASADNNREISDFVKDSFRDLIYIATERENRFEATILFLDTRTDLDMLARYSAGPNWRQMDDSQRIRYRKMVRWQAARLLSRRLGGETQEEPDPEMIRDPFWGTLQETAPETWSGSIEIVRTVPLRERGDRKPWLVTTKIVFSNLNRPLNIEWRISMRESEYRIEDLLVEGISVAGIHRDRMQARFQKHRYDIDAVLASLETEF